MPKHVPGEGSEPETGHFPPELKWTESLADSQHSQSLGSECFP